jgi:hypothetical protein
MSCDVEYVYHGIGRTRNATSSEMRIIRAHFDKYPKCAGSMIKNVHKVMTGYHLKREKGGKLLD